MATKKPTFCQKYRLFARAYIHLTFLLFLYKTKWLRAQKGPPFQLRHPKKKILKYCMNLEGINRSANKLNIIFLPQLPPLPQTQNLKWRLYLDINMRSLHNGNNRRHIIISDIQKTKYSTYREKVKYAQFFMDNNSLVIGVAMLRNIWQFFVAPGWFCYTVRTW